MTRVALAATVLCGLLAAGCGAGDHDRVIVLGLDAVDPDVVDLLIAEGKLPNFERLKREGAYSRLHSPPPLLSPIIWTTIATGKKPSDHGIGHFITDDPETGRPLPVTSDMRRVKALWNIFSERDRKVAVVGWWATWPAETVRGVLVSDHAAYHFLMGQMLNRDSSTAGVTYPEDTLSEIGSLLRQPADVGYDDLAPFIDIDPAELDRPFEFENELSHFRWALAAAETYRDIGLHLWRTERPDLLMVYIEAVDTTSHLFGHLFRQQGLVGELVAQQRRYGRAVEQMYVFADSVVGAYLAQMDERTTLVVVSDHGFKLGELPNDPSRTRDMRRVSEAYHRPEGILFLYGADVRSGVRVDHPETVDIAPTVLSLGGLPVADDLVGRVLDEVVERAAPARIATYESPGAKPPRAVRGRDDDVDSALLGRLESLGYIGAGSTSNDRNLANILLREGRFEEAANSFRALAEANPDEATFHAALASALTGLGRYDEALPEFNRALEIDPLEIRAYHNRGWLRELMGDIDGAIEDYRRALRYGGEFGPSERALERLGVGLTGKVPANPAERQAAALLREAAGLMKRGDYDGADERIEKARVLAPDAAVVYQYEANVAYLKGDRKRAARALERAIEIDPDSALFRENLRKLRESD